MYKLKIQNILYIKIYLILLITKENVLVSSFQYQLPTKLQINNLSSSFTIHPKSNPKRRQHLITSISSNDLYDINNEG